MLFDLEGVRRRLPGRRIEWFTSIASTMTEAARLAREDCPSGTLVGAKEQKAGIGRHGRTWHSPPRSGLYVSFVLRLPVAADHLPLLMLAVGLAVRDAIVETSGLAPDLRWPNDVLLNGKKCAGILAQMEGGAIVVGIGINVNHSSFPPRLAGIATSLRLEGARVTRENILVALARSLDEWAELVASSPGKILARFGEVSSYAYNRRVRVEQEGTALEGVTCGLDSMGFLRLRQDSGVEATILAGGVRPV